MEGGGGRSGFKIVLYSHSHPTAGEDYIPFNITTVIRPQDINTNNGGGQFCASFCTTDDIIVEGIETFYVVVSPLTDRVTLLNDERDRIVVTIKDDDGMMSHDIIIRSCAHAMISTHSGACVSGY